MVDKRVISAIIAIPLLVFFTLMGGVIFKIGVFSITAIAMYEYYNAYKNTNHKVIAYILLVGFIVNTFLVYLNKNEYMMPILLLIVLLSMATPVFNEKYTVISSSITVIGFIYIIVFLSLLIPIRERQNGNSLIWLVFIISWCSDTFAYYIGKNFGKKKLCPKVSPKKTILGFIGGILGSVVGLIIWGLLNQNINFHWYQLILLGISGGVISQIGDLSASLIKRYIGIKDYGNIMPGHGGILDRFDSILFTAPIVYYYIVLFLG